MWGVAYNVADKNVTKINISVINLMDLHESSYRGVIFVEPHRKREISLCLMFKTSFH